MLDDSMPTWNSSTKARKQLNKTEKAVGIDEHERSIGGRSPPKRRSIRDKGIKTQSNKFLKCPQSNKRVGSNYNSCLNQNAFSY